MSREQILLSLFPAPSEPPATEQVLVPASQAETSIFEGVMEFAENPHCNYLYFNHLSIRVFLMTP